MFNKLEARVLSEYKRSRAAPSTFCTLIKHYFSFIKHYTEVYTEAYSQQPRLDEYELNNTFSCSNNISHNLTMKIKTTTYTVFWKWNNNTENIQDYIILRITKLLTYW
jgi:hypothetical protein